MDALPVITTIRLKSQQLMDTQLKTPRELVSWMGAIQAQDFNMGKWAIGVRLPGITDKDVEQAINNGDIIRTHILRPTWHLVSRDDIHWMSELSNPRLKSVFNSYCKQIQLPSELIVGTINQIVKCLEEEPNLTSKEIEKKLNDNGTVIDSNWIKTIIFGAELEGIVCNGCVKNKKQTYDLLERKVAKTGLFNREEALYKLAFKYFSSHGPATLADFVWWSGLTMTDAKKSLQLINQNFIFEEINNQTYIFSAESATFKLEEDIVHLLPAFDELFVSYKDRKEIIAVDHHKKVIVSNGVFKPAIFLNGEVIGIWNRVVKKNRIIAVPECFSIPDKSAQMLIDKAVSGYDKYMMNPE